MEIKPVNKPSYDSFLVALKLGQIYEQKAISKLVAYYKSEYHVTATCNDNRYDFVMSNNKSYEVKADIMASKTKKVFIENIQFNKVSGVDVTKATYYIIILTSSNMFKTFETYYMISVKRLKWLIKNNKFNKYYSDIYKSGYLFDVDIITANSIDISG